MTAATSTASVTTDPSAIYKPRRLRGASAWTIQGAAAGGAGSVRGPLGGNDGGNGGGITVAAGSTTGVIVRVGEIAAGKALASAARKASAD